MLTADLSPTYAEVRQLEGETISGDFEAITGASKPNIKKSPTLRNVFQPLDSGSDMQGWSIEDISTDKENLLGGVSGDETLNSRLKVQSGQVSEIRNLYFDDFVTPELKTGINLLETSQKLVDKSLHSFQQGRRKESDELIMQVKTFLPELFCCRTISESFGAVINSIATALSNMGGTPLSENQLNALLTLITALLREPAMPFMKAVAYVSEFEKADFEVESAGLDSLIKLVEMLDSNETEIING